MSPGATFERVYRSLKEEIGSGRFRPGDPLEPRVLSDELHASITPVRDALHRLVGERLVEAPRGDGFRTPLVTEVGLRHLYAWNRTLLLAALRAPGAGDHKADDEPLPAGREPMDAGRLFGEVAALSGSPEHVDAVGRAGDRLRPARRVELRILGDATPELEVLQRSLRQADRSELRRSILSFHRRRERAAPSIVEAMMRGT